MDFHYLFIYGFFPIVAIVFALAMAYRFIMLLIPRNLR